MSPSSISCSKKCPSLSEVRVVSMDCTCDSSPELYVFLLPRRELLDKKATQSVANNINYRHRMAQYASRASVNLHTHIFFRNQRRDETGYVLFVRQNAIQVSQ